jgi:hypothetical protein
MSTPPKRPKTVNRLQQLITEWERESGQPVRRLNLKVASMMLAGALRRAVDDDGAVVFVTRGGVAMELRAGEKARVTGDVDLILRGDPESLLVHHDLPRLERPLCRHGQQPRYADHRPRRSNQRHPRVHLRHRHKLKARISFLHVASLSFVRPGRGLRSGSQRSTSGAETLGSAVAAR